MFCKFPTMQGRKQSISASRSMARTWLAAGLLMCSTTQAIAQANHNTNLEADVDWSDFSEMVRDLPDVLLDSLPERQRNDPDIQDGVKRVALSAVASAAIDALASDPDHPVFIPQVNQFLNVGQPNSDTTYRLARITPGGSYRLRGRKGNVRMAIIAETGLLPGNASQSSDEPGAPQPIHDINALGVDEDGRFDVLLSAERPDGYNGDWWQLQPGTDRLLLRLVSADWEREVDPALSIERLDAPVRRPASMLVDMKTALSNLINVTNFLAPVYLHKVESLREAGYINRLRKMPESTLGLPGQVYYEGAYELDGEEALIIEAKHPARCEYRSIIVTNDVFETSDWFNNQGSLNDAQAAVDRDGILRIVLAGKDPGVPNWLDTAGYRTGSIQGRWANCDTQPIPTVRKVPFADIRKHLPSDTPTVTKEQRETIVRDRRAGSQQRPLW
ncbi:MAG: hypothetical protein KDE55_03395 [Novosphingobium sp.]|nr:hypothetical protein [Novosphingobium sp.]